MTPREMAGKIRTVQQDMERRKKELSRRLDEGLRKFNQELSELRNRSDHYSPAPRDPITPPDFPEALKDLGLEEPDVAR